MRLHDMTTIQEWHFAVRLHPDLVSCMFGEDRESSDMEAKLASLCEFACAMDVSWHFFAGWNVEVPRQVPRDSRLSLATDVAKLARESRTW